MARPAGQEWGIAAGGGVVSAVLFLATVFFSAFGIALAYFALLPLLLVGFGWGIKAVLLSAALGTLVVAAVTSLTGGVLFALVCALPAAFTVWLGLRNRSLGGGAIDWYPVGNLLAWIAVYGCAQFTVLALMGGDSGMKETLAQFEAMMASVLPVDQNPQVAALVRTIAGIWLALTIFSWMVMMVVNGALAQSLLERYSRNLRPKPRYAEVALPEWLAAVTAAAAALALVAPAMDLTALGFAARNTALALLGAYFLVGLAVVHVWARRWSAKAAVLAGFYLLLLVFGWRGMLLVAGLGFLEQGLFLRRRFAASRGQEDEE